MDTKDDDDNDDETPPEHEEDEYDYNSIGADDASMMSLPSVAPIQAIRAQDAAGKMDSPTIWTSRADGKGSPEEIAAAKDAAWALRKEQAWFPPGLPNSAEWQAYRDKSRHLRRFLETPHQRDDCPWPEMCRDDHRPADTY
jgi:hypothetical protein